MQGNQLELDLAKPHGVIWGHDEARYTQNGALFDAAGKSLAPVEKPAAPIYGKKKVSLKIDSLDPQDDDDEDEVNTDPVSSLITAECQFLTKILSGGAVQQANIKRESENAGLIWSNVTSEAAKMNIGKFKQGSFNMWRLPEEY